MIKKKKKEKNLTFYLVQIKGKLPRCSFCLYVTSGSRADFATEQGKEGEDKKREKHNGVKARKASAVQQLIKKIEWGSTPRLRVDLSKTPTNYIIFTLLLLKKKIKIIKRVKCQKAFIPSQRKAASAINLLQRSSRRKELTSKLTDRCNFNLA